jgi:hypothetical protein
LGGRQLNGVRQAAAMPERHLDPTSSEELRLLYQTSINDIAFAKRQQYQTTNYVLVADAAIVASHATISSGVTWVPLLFLSAALTVVLAIALGYGLRFVARLQCNLAKYRARLLRCREAFGPEFKMAFGPDRPPGYATPSHQADVSGVLQAAQLLGFALSVALIWVAWAAAQLHK